MKRYTSILAFIIYVLFYTLAWGQNDYQSINIEEDTNKFYIKLTEDDRFVTRNAEILLKSDEKRSNIIRIENYEPEKGVLIIEDIFGDKAEIPLSEIKKMVFYQQIQQPNMVAQMAPEIITAEKEAPITVKIPISELKIEDNQLVLSKSRVELDKPKTLEVLYIACDQDECEIMIQNVSYSSKMYGGGGSSGVSGFEKGLQ